MPTTKKALAVETGAPVGRLDVRTAVEEFGLRVERIGLSSEEDVPAAHIRREDETTDSTLDVLRIARHTTGLEAEPGIGAALVFECQSDENDWAYAGSIAGVLTNSTPAEEACALVFSTGIGGDPLQEHVRIDDVGNVGIGTAAPTSRLQVVGGVQVGTPTGGDQGAGSINVSGDIYKNGTAYTNPDYVFLHAFQSERVSNYPGPVPLDELEASLRGAGRLPGISDRPTGLFSRQDILLEKLEEAYLYILELRRRVERLEGAPSSIASSESNERSR